MTEARESRLRMSLFTMHYKLDAFAHKPTKLLYGRHIRDGARARGRTLTLRWFAGPLLN